MHSAVRQWAGNVADLDFACAIRAAPAPAFLLVAMHLPEVEALSVEDAAKKKLVPASAKKKCAFYRVWVRSRVDASHFHIHSNIPNSSGAHSASSSWTRRSRAVSP